MTQYPLRNDTALQRRYVVFDTERQLYLAPDGSYRPRLEDALRLSWRGARDMMRDEAATGRRLQVHRASWGKQAKAQP